MSRAVPQLVIADNGGKAPTASRPIAPRTIAIIGGGFSGTMVAVHLLRSDLRERTSIVLMEREPRLARGVAYSTRNPVHLLNVPAGRMSALPDDPDHFLRFARTRDASVTGSAFVPRLLYGDYLESLLEESAFSAHRAITLERVLDEAVSIEPHDGQMHRVHLCTGNPIVADHVILALGNFAPANPAPGDDHFYCSARYIRDPWAPGALTNIVHDQPVLLIGAGLTMIDVVLQLRAIGHRGAIHALSRRGLLPKAHRSPSQPPRWRLDLEAVAQWDRTASGLLRAVREEVRTAEQRGEDWREVINALRPLTQDLWRSLGVQEQRRFLRHIRSFWDVHRHRSAGPVAEAVQSLIDAGTLRSHAGRVQGYLDLGQSIDVRYQPRGGDANANLRVAHVINCTGPASDISQVDDRLIQDIRSRGLIRCDAHRLGLDTTDDGHVISDQGVPSPSLWAVGPLRKGGLWESTAVPELREQAKSLAWKVLQSVAATRQRHNHLD
jgi:uncharacterized NAD(P)/FAD-binding protein YdhS